MERREGDAPASGDWTDLRRVEEYLSREIPHRAIAEAMLVEALPPRVDQFVDLGTGDGRLLALVHETHSGAHGVGIDSSAPMLERAREKLADAAELELRQHDLNRPLPDIDSIDAVISALAIHHLPDTRKRTLFDEIHSWLVPGGVFVNLDLVASTSLERHQRFRDAIGRREDDPSDRLGDVCDQLTWLREVGFAEVECEFKWLELALVVAVRAKESS
jgi:tRNA (cmo5U34)-methyltransferase